MNEFGHKKTVSVRFGGITSDNEEGVSFSVARVLWKNDRWIPRCDPILPLSHVLESCEALELPRSEATGQISRKCNTSWT